MKNAYDKVALTFTLEKELVEGVLNGDYRHWTFTSQSPPFLAIVPSGVLQSSSAWNGVIPKEIHMLYKTIWTAAEAKGFQFDGD